MNKLQEGELLVVATPIGHLEDISSRALSVLSSVDLILAEDTRVTKKLLHRYQIKTKIKSFYEQKEWAIAQEIIKQIQQGLRVALVSDAGTPLISDPGYYLVRLAREAGIKVQPAPGASALIAALSVSGLSADEFVFKGFLPTKKVLLDKAIEQINNCSMTCVLYEAPHRIIRLIKNLAQSLDSRRLVFLAREMTKVYETYKLMTLKEALTYIQDDNTVTKGEWVVILEGNKEVKTVDFSEENKVVLELLLQELSVKKAVLLASKIMGLNKNTIYSLALTIKRQKEL